MNNKTNKYLIGTISILMGLVLLYSYLLSVSEFKLKAYDVKGGGNNADYLNQTIELEFSRPLSGSDNYQEQISINPEVEFSAFRASNKLQINLKNELEAEVDYELTVNELSDIYGNKLSNQVTIEFRTEATELVYLHFTDDNKVEIKNYSIGAQIADTITKVNNIINIRANKDYVAYTTKTPGGKQLVIVKRSDGEEIYRFEDKDVFAIELDNIRQRLIFLAEDQKLYQLSLSDFSIENIPLPSSLDLVDEVFFSEVNNQLLVKQANTRIYYLVSLFNVESTPVPIGEYFNTIGFSPSGNQILFTSVSPYSTDILHTLIESGGNQVDISPKSLFFPQYLANSKTLLFNGYVDEQNSLRRVILYDYDKLEITNSLTPEQGITWESPVSSRNGKLIAVEEFDEEAKDDLLNYWTAGGLQSKPKHGQLVFFEVHNGELNKIEDTIDGIHPIFIN